MTLIIVKKDKKDSNSEFLFSREINNTFKRILMCVNVLIDLIEFLTITEVEISNNCN